MPCTACDLQRVSKTRVSGGEPRVVLQLAGGGSMGGIEAEEALDEAFAGRHLGGVLAERGPTAKKNGDGEVGL